MTDDDQWRRTEATPSGPSGPRARGPSAPPPTGPSGPPPTGPSGPPARGPSAPPDARFNPLATAIGVFTAVAIPIVVVGYTRPSGANTSIIVVGVLIGVVAGVLAGIWVDHRNGRVWRGPQL